MLGFNQNKNIQIKTLIWSVTDHVCDIVSATCLKRHLWNRKVTVLLLVRKEDTYD